jgi:hypothetical protein
MPDYLLPCTCGQKVRVANAQAGGQVTCVCGRSLAVPTLRGLRELEPAPHQTIAKTKPAWNPARGIIFATSLMSAVVGLVIVVIQLWQYSQVVGYAVDRTDEEEHFVAGLIDSMTPEQALEQWPQVIEEGLGEPTPPQWMVARRIAALRLRWATIGGAIAVGGVLLAVATMFVGRRRQ